MARLFKVTVTPSLKRLAKKIDRVLKPVDKATAQKAGNATVRMMKRKIAGGNSPIMGKGRFPSYKNPTKYPGKLKSHTPVNLKLTGAMLKNLKAKASLSRILGWVFSIGYRDPDQADKETGHRRGKFGQPRRPTIPIKGEQFSGPIAKVYVKIFRARMRKLIRKKL